MASEPRSDLLPLYLESARHPFRCPYGCRRTGPLCKVRKIRQETSPVPNLPCSVITIADSTATVEVFEGSFIVVPDVNDLTAKQIREKAREQHWKLSGGKAIYEADKEKEHALAPLTVTDYLKQCTPWRTGQAEEGYFRGIMTGFDPETDSFSPGDRGRFCEWDNWKKMRWPTKDEYRALQLIHPGAFFGVPFSWHGLHGN